MRTDILLRHLGTVAILLLPALPQGCFPSPATAQLSAHLLDEETEVRSLRFRFLDSESFPESRLKRQIALTARGGGYGLKKSLSFLPFVSEPEPHPFDPLSLQRDVARLRAFYQGAGFPEVDVRYEVALDPEENLVDVEFLIREGTPRTLIGLSFSGPSGAPLHEILPPQLAPGWRDFEGERQALLGQRFGDGERAQLEGSPIRWLLDRGYPFPESESRVEIDATGLEASLFVTVTPGSRSRVGALAVQGAVSVGDGVVLREIPLRRGDWYSARQVNEGRRRISALGLFGMALADVTPQAPSADSAVQVLYRVREVRPRSLSGFLGYTNVGGLAFGGQWEHRNFSGGARTLALNGTAETGLFAFFTEVPDEFFRASVSLRQPFVFVSGLSLLASPFGEYRNDYRDRSWEAGADGTLFFQYAPLKAVSLRYRASLREVLEHRLGDVTLGTDALVDAVIAKELLEDQLVVSAFTLSGTFGRLDDQANPRNGFILQPSLEVTGPKALPTNEYVKGDLWASYYRALGAHARFAGSIRAGRVFPFGGSIPASDSTGLTEFVQLRDVTLTAGGPTDVRGWSSRSLGPKVPDVEIVQEGDSTRYGASRYLPLGGLARLSFALEIQFPLPGFPSRLSGHSFLDGGRVWTPDHRFIPGKDPFKQDRFFYSTGAGLGIQTPVGPLRMSVGYKLNPSPLDVRDPGEVLEYILTGGPLDELDQNVPEGWWRRLQLHLTIGRVF
jgi:outer membrane protein insertion porin family